MALTSKTVDSVVFYNGWVSNINNTTFFERAPSVGIKVNFCFFSLLKKAFNSQDWQFKSPMES